MVLAFICFIVLHCSSHAYAYAYGCVIGENWSRKSFHKRPRTTITTNNRPTTTASFTHPTHMTETGTEEFLVEWHRGKEEEKNRKVRNRSSAQILCYQLLCFSRHDKLSSQLLTEYLCNICIIFFLSLHDFSYTN